MFDQSPPFSSTKITTNNKHNLLNFQNLDVHHIDQNENYGGEILHCSAISQSYGVQIG